MLWKYSANSPFEIEILATCNYRTYEIKPMIGIGTSENWSHIPVYKRNQHIPHCTQ